VVKRAEPGSSGNDLGAAIPVSELQPIVQGLMDDVLAFQRLLVCSERAFAVPLF
jgi:hypothetical protein